MGIDKDVLDKLLASYQKPEDTIGENGLLKTAHESAGGASDGSRADDPSGYEKHDPVGYR